MSELDLITFDTSGFAPQGDESRIRMWHSPRGDAVTLYHFSIPPNIEADLGAVDEVRAFYRNLTTASGLAIIEVEVPMVDGCRVVRAIVKIPQKPHGMTYLGSVTLPFRDFSYVLKVQGLEHGTTGIRDAEVLNDLLSRGEVSVSKASMEGWMQDPYNASVRALLMRNPAEAEEYDVKYPHDPLSRVRLILNHIQATLPVAAELRSAPGFAYSRPQSKRKSWWRRW